MILCIYFISSKYLIVEMENSLGDIIHMIKQTAPLISTRVKDPLYCTHVHLVLDSACHTVSTQNRLGISHEHRIT